jgi:competence protein ComEA
VIVPERINPNAASMASLVRLPGVGRIRAMEIIQYRQEAGGIAFESPASLEEIRGIGPKTIEAMSPWLTFEAAVPDTAADAVDDGQDTDQDPE